MTLDVYELTSRATRATPSPIQNEYLASVLMLLVVVLGALHRFSSLVCVRFVAFFVSTALFVCVVVSVMHSVFSNDIDNQNDADAIKVLTLFWIAYPFAAVFFSLKERDTDRILLKDAIYALLDVLSKAGLATYVAYTRVPY